MQVTKGGLPMHQSQMLKGILEGCVMKTVSNRSCYSQEIIIDLNRKGFDNISEGTLFPLLLRLDKEGYFTIQMVPSSLGPSRKYYQLNQSGQLALQRFISEWNGLKSVVDQIMAEDETNG